MRRMNSMIIQWRIYLAFVVGDPQMLSNAKVDEFVAMVEHARKIHWEKKIDDIPIHKQK